MTTCPSNLELAAAYVLVAVITGVFMSVVTNVAGGGGDAGGSDMGSLVALMAVFALIPPVLVGGEGAL